MDKPSSSTTVRTQSADQELFITKNNHLKSITDKDVNPDSPKFKNVSTAFASHQSKMSSTLGRYNYKSMASAQEYLVKFVSQWQKYDGSSCNQFF